jgi:hypothetical protein
MKDMKHAVAAVSGIVAGVAPIAGAMPEGTPRWLQISVTVLGLLTTLVANLAKIRGNG